MGVFKKLFKKRTPTSMVSMARRSVDEEVGFDNVPLHDLEDVKTVHFQNASNVTINVGQIPNRKAKSTHYDGYKLMFLGIACICLFYIAVTTFLQYHSMANKIPRNATTTVILGGKKGGLFQNGTKNF